MQARAIFLHEHSRDCERGGGGTSGGVGVECALEFARASGNGKGMRAWRRRRGRRRRLKSIIIMYEDQCEQASASRVHTDVLRRLVEVFEPFHASLNALQRAQTRRSEPSADAEKAEKDNSVSDSLHTHLMSTV